MPGKTRAPGRVRHARLTHGKHFHSDVSTKWKNEGHFFVHAAPKFQTLVLGVEYQSKLLSCFGATSGQEKFLEKDQKAMLSRRS